MTLLPPPFEHANAHLTRDCENAASCADCCIFFKNYLRPGHESLCFHETDYVFSYLLASFQKAFNITKLEEQQLEFFIAAGSVLLQEYVHKAGYYFNSGIFFTDPQTFWEYQLASWMVQEQLKQD